ncbi:MAG: triose-phosphate isomerase [Sphingorhabdus sp.]
MRKLVVGNWKMNGVSADLAEIALIAESATLHDGVDSGLCLPATLIGRAVSHVPAFPIGGQDCHMAATGAHTGCVSATMLADTGAVMTIVGHSERRAAQHESDADVRAKALAARAAGLKSIVCVGETLEERDAGQALNIVLGQLDGSLPDDSDGKWLSVAYEPVWAIGTGRIPEDADVAEMHAAIRAELVSRFGENGAAIRILYGGSMNGDNAAGLMTIPNVDGGLIGGASLTAAKFDPILAAATELRKSKAE